MQIGIEMTDRVKGPIHEPANCDFSRVYIGGVDDPFERGRALGRAMASGIKASIEGHAETFAHYTGLDWSKIRDHAARFAEPIGAYDPEILQEMYGMAAGAGVEETDILALNSRNETMFGLGAPTQPECTTFGVAKSAMDSRHTLLGQNWDWRPRAGESVTIVEMDQGPYKPSIVMLPEAGLVGKMGYNNLGLGVVLNMLATSLDTGEPGVPIHVILRGILNSHSTDEAIAAIKRAKRGASATYVLGSASGELVAVEAGPGGPESVFLIPAESEVLTHSNHFVADVPFEDVGRLNWPDSIARISLMRQGLEARPVSVAQIEATLRDESAGPGSICRSVDPSLPYVEGTDTVTSVIFDLDDQSMLVAHGRPVDVGYHKHVPAFAQRVRSGATDD